jgi:hypothetical protein
MVCMKAAILLSLSLASVPARAEVIHAMKNAIAECVTMGPKGMHVFTPDCSGRNLRAGVYYRVHYNKLGLRDKNFPRKAPKGVTRILILGSSDLTGPGLGPEMTPPKRTEAHLRKKGRKVEVINASSDAYFATLNAIRLPEYLEAYSPQVVAYFLSPRAEVFGDAMHARRLVLDAQGYPERLLEEENPVPDWIADQLSEESAANLRRAAYTFHIHKARIALSKEATVALSEGQGVPGVFTSTISSILAMKKRAEALGAKFVLIVRGKNMSNRMNISHDQDFRIASFMDRFAPNLQAPTDRLFEELAKSGVTAHFVDHMKLSAPGLTLNGDYHPNEKGSDMMGEEMAKIMNESGLFR